MRKWAAVAKDLLIKVLLGVCLAIWFTVLAIGIAVLAPLYGIALMIDWRPKRRKKEVACFS